MHACVCALLCVHECAYVCVCVCVFCCVCSAVCVLVCVHRVSAHIYVCVPSTGDIAAEEVCEADRWR